MTTPSSRGSGWTCGSSSGRGGCGRSRSKRACGRRPPAGKRRFPRRANVNPDPMSEVRERMSAWPTCWRDSVLRRRTGSVERSRRRPTLRRARGNPCRRAATRSWSRPPVREKRCRPSSSRSTGCSARRAPRFGCRSRTPRQEGRPESTADHHPHPVHLAAEGPRRRRRAEPPLASRRDRAVRAPSRDRGALGDRGRPLGRHEFERPPQARDRASRHPHHHARVALPHAHEPGGRDAARRAHGDHRRGARGRGHQARRTPGREPRAARRPARRAGSAHRTLGDRASDRRGGPLPRRSAARRHRRPQGDQSLRPLGRGADRRHAQPAAAPGVAGSRRSR